MRDIAIVAFEETPWETHGAHTQEMLLGVLQTTLARVNVDRNEVGFTVSGSCDFLTGLPFSFVHALDAVGAWPPIQESHVEMDGAWALYEAWVRLQHGDIDTALVYAFGQPTAGPIAEVMTLQLDPYYQAPLGPDATSLAALQAQAMLDAGDAPRDFAEVALRAGRGADIEQMLNAAPVAAPLRPHDTPVYRDGAAAILLAADDKARALVDKPAWIRGIAHNIESHGLGTRDLCRAESAERAFEAAGGPHAPEIAELHAQFSHEALLLSRAFGLDDSVTVNPSGGALAHNPVMVAGLNRIGHAASAILTGGAQRTLGHASSGPCLQQNLVVTLEAR